jgi:hypothetical protein
MRRSAIVVEMGEATQDLAASTLNRPKQKWLTEHAEGCARDLSQRR